MFTRTKLSLGLLAAFGTLSAVAPGAQAQTLERVEITGSSIRRIASEGALPVVTLKREDIERTGATSAVDLLQRLSTVQGGTMEANSVGGSTYGFSGVSVHNIGETRTLVLLNGHRLSQFGGQTLTGFAAGMDLNAIPIAAIERVEVLTDGASALYGADAIAGVVNFITKRNTEAGSVSVGFSNPRDGAKEKRISASKGFGQIDKDGYNFIMSFGHDERTKLRGVDRDYAKTGNLVFSKDGKIYRSQNYSASTIPANVLDDDGNLINPYLRQTGQCAPNSFRVIDGADDFCGFDYVSTLEIYPERKRDSGMASLTVRAGDHQIFADVLASRTEQTSRIAPVPGGVSIPAGSTYHNQYLLPLGITGGTTAFYRVYDLGARTNKDKSDFIDVAVGSKGVILDWDYSATLTHSESKVKGYISGYPGALALAALRRSGLLNPFVLPGQQTPDAQTALNGVNYDGYWDGGVAKLDGVQLQGSREVAALPAGPMMLGLGVSAQRESFESKPSPFAQGITSNPVTGELCDPNAVPSTCDQRFGDAAAQVPYSAKRDSYAAFAELNIPVVKNFDMTGALRFDHYSDFGDTVNGKASFRWSPATSLLVRGSVGTGFHAPSVPQVKASPQSYGVTEDPYTCTPELQAVATSLGAVCQPGSRQYDVVAGGNESLKPEKSRQATLGMRIEPHKTVSFGVDYWWVAIKDAFGQVDEATVFAEPNRFPGAWTTALDIGTGTRYLAWNSANLNLGKEYSSGLDFDVATRLNTSLGNWDSRVTATYMLREKYQLEQGGKYYSNIADNTQGAMTFRWKGAWRNSLKMGDWVHALTVNFQSGYKDAETTVEVLDAAGNVTGTEDIRLKVKPYYTFDWQTQWSPMKAFDITVGLLNVFDKKPPLVLTTTGGQQVGYDGNLFDPRGRTIYANLTYKF